MVKKSKSDSGYRTWNSEVVRLWWFCLLIILFLILFSGRSFGQASISGYAWMDLNKDGLQGTGERGFSGVRVELLHRLSGANFESLTSLRTQSDGSFLILVSSTLLPGEFYLRFEKVQGMYFSLPDRGSDDLTDSDVDTSSGQTPIFALADQANAVGWNAGYMTSPIAPPRQPAANLYLNVATSSDSAQIGQNIEFTIVVTNSGPDPSITPVLTMELDPALELQTANPAPENTAATPLRWSLPSLAMGSEYRITLAVQVIHEGDATGAICLAATTEDPNLDNNCQTYLFHNSVPVELTEFLARFEQGGVVLRWTTASETENYGFQVWRAASEAGPYTRITPALIEGAGTTSSEHRYEFLDAEVAGGGSYFYKLQDIDYSGQAAWHGPIAAVAAQPARFELSQNYPNPFNSETRIRFRMSEAGSAQLTIFNTLGQQVKQLFAQEWSPGEHEVRWDGTDAFDLPVASGLYIYLLRAGDHVEKRIMNLVK